MNYRLVEVNTAHASNLCYEMECHVNQLMKSGWEPVGGVSMHTYIDSSGRWQRIVYQPLVRKARLERVEEKPKELV